MGNFEANFHTAAKLAFIHILVIMFDISYLFLAQKIFFIAPGLMGLGGFAAMYLIALVFVI